MIRGTLAGMQPGTILGHEGVVEEVGRNVRNLNVGDRVVIPSTTGCGYCMFCRRGFYAQCDNANPNGPQAGSRPSTVDHSPRDRSMGCRPSTPG